MGKGYQNFMCKKFFHPTSFDNQKKKWMAQEKSNFKAKEQQEKLEQYKREQDLLSNRALMGDKKAQLGLSFMYDVPPGANPAEKDQGEDQKEYKFEWQRKFNAPREKYVKDSNAMMDQPFGIEVRNSRCIKCHEWGHMNTDNICPLYGHNLTAEPPRPGTNPSKVMEKVREKMEEDGILLKRNVWDRPLDKNIKNQRVLTDIEPGSEAAVFVQNLSAKDKAKLLRKLEKLDRKEERRKVKKKSKTNKQLSSSSSSAKVKKEEKSPDSWASRSASHSPSHRHRQETSVKKSRRERGNDDDKDFIWIEGRQQAWQIKSGASVGRGVKREADGEHRTTTMDDRHHRRPAHQRHQEERQEGKDRNRFTDNDNDGNNSGRRKQRLNLNLSPSGGTFSRDVEIEAIASPASPAHISSPSSQIKKEPERHHSEEENSVAEDPSNRRYRQGEDKTDTSSRSINNNRRERGWARKDRSRSRDRRRRRLDEERSCTDRREDRSRRHSREKRPDTKERH